MNMISTFESVKEKVLKIIDDNKSNEITRKTENLQKGVYMLYVDDFSDDKIIPFYIGETGKGDANFQERYKTHFCELIALNRLEYNYYKTTIYNGYYTGRYKACKIFSYLVNHNCNLKNFHMIILDVIEDIGERKQKELNYINDLLAPFFGFNQINSISKRAEYEQDSGAYKKFFEDDIRNLSLYNDYGYCFFNSVLANELLPQPNTIKEISMEEQVSSIIPSRYNESHPLGDVYEEYVFPAEIKNDNICYINIEYTCFQGDVKKDYYPAVCKVDYLLIKDGLKIEKRKFIKCPLSYFFENGNIYYRIEKDFFKYLIKPEEFNPFENINLVGADTHIPLKMEYRNGINEWTLKDKVSEDAIDVFKEIDSLIDTKTKINYTSSGYKSSIKRFSEIIERTPNGLLEKLIKKVK